MPIKAALRKLRKAKGLTQADAAAAIGISRSLLANIESGYSLPGRETLVSLARFYGIPAGQLLDAATLDGPNEGEFVKDADELALLRFWRSLSHDQRLLMLRMLRAPDDSLGRKR